MKLMFLNPTNADLELIGWLKTQTQHEVITVNSAQLDQVANQRTPEAKLQAFQSLINGNPAIEPDMNDADWSLIDNLEHNKVLDSEQ